jgi:chromosome segregation ATPase
MAHENCYLPGFRVQTVSEMNRLKEDYRVLLDLLHANSENLVSCREEIVKLKNELKNLKDQNICLNKRLDEFICKTESSINELRKNQGYGKCECCGSIIELEGEV